LSTITDALNHQTTFTYNSAGQPLTVTNALNETVTFGYSGGDLVSVTSPLGHVTTLLTDGAGRVVRTTDPSGRSAQLTFDELDLVTSVISDIGILGAGMVPDVCAESHDASALQALQDETADRRP